MQYKYRWYYAASIFLSVIGTAFFYFILPKWNDISSLRSTDAQLLADLMAIKAFASHPHRISSYRTSQPEKMAELAALAHANNVTLQTLNVLGRQSQLVAHLDTIHLSASGQFNDVAAFLTSVSRQMTMSVMTDFVYKAERRDYYSFNMDFMLWEEGDKQAVPLLELKNSERAHNPFCFVSSDVFQQNDASVLQHISLDQIHMVGSFRLGSRVVGMVSLPSGDVFEVRLGMKMGSEQGVVTAILRDQMVIAVSGRQQRLLMGEKDETKTM